MKLYHDLPAPTTLSGNVFAMIPKPVANYILTEFGEGGIDGAVSSFIWVINGRVDGVVVLDRVKEFCELVGIEVVKINEEFRQSTDFFSHIRRLYKPNFEDYYSQGVREDDDE